MTLTTILMVTILQSPRGQETYDSVRMAKLPPMPLVAASLPQPNLYTNSFSWNGSAQAWGYRLYQSAGNVTNTYDCTDTNTTIVYNWPDNVERFAYWVTATNFVGESDPSEVIYFPPKPHTHLVLSWSGTLSVSNSSSLPARWTLLTNGSGPLIFPNIGSRFFSAGTNKLSITGTNL